MRVQRTPLGASFSEQSMTSLVLLVVGHDSRVDSISREHHPPFPDTAIWAPENFDAQVSSCLPPKIREIFVLAQNRRWHDLF